MEWPNLEETVFAELDLGTTLVNLGLVLLLGQVLAWHYRLFAGVLSNKRKFSKMLVFISATTMVVISVVKTSLALSLGLVGALSIIRFRTPIKEPEELAYLFLAVAVGIGLGADQRVATSVMILVILAYLAISSRTSKKALSARTIVHVSARLGGASEAARSTSAALEALLGQTEGAAGTVDLRRVDSTADTLDASLVLDLDDARRIGPLIEGIQGILPEASVSVVEASSLD